MARLLFATDVVLTSIALPDVQLFPGAPFTLWTDREGGAQITDCVAVDGFSALATDGSGRFIADANGQLPELRGPDEVPLMWRDLGTGKRFPWVASDRLKDMLVWFAGVDEYLQDRVADMFSGQQGSGVSLAYNDTTGKLTLIVSGAGGGTGGSVSWDSIPDKPSTFPPSSHTHTASQISDSTAVGRSLVTAADAATARAAIGAGTGNGSSNLAIGTTATTAAAGNHAHNASEVNFTPSGALTATNVQAAIQQAATLGGSGGSTGAGSIEGAYSATDTAPTDAQALTLYGEGGYFTIDDPTQVRSRGASNDCTSELIGALSFSKSVELGIGDFLVSAPLGDATGFVGKGPGLTRIRIRSTYAGGQRFVKDGTTTSGSPTAGSQTGGFTAGHVGRRINATGIPADTTIVAVAGDGKSATMSANATATATGLSMAWGEPLIRALKSARIGNFSFVGGNSTTSCLTNPDIGVAIGIGLGAARVTIRDVQSDYLNGWLVESLGQLVGAPYYMVIDGLVGTYNAGGVHLLGIASSNFGAQITMDHINLQVVERYDLIWLDSCNDVQIGKVNGAVSGLVYGVAGLRISGNSSSVIVDNWDVGAYPTLPAADAIIIIGDTGTPNNVWINSGVAQGGENAVKVVNGFNLHFRLQASRSGSDGVLIVSGNNIDLCGMTYARNGYRAVQALTTLTTVSGSNVVNDASAPFTPSHQYRKITASGLPSTNGGNYITGYVSPTQVTVATAATASGTVAATVGTASELRVLDATSEVRSTQSDFTTPVGTGAQQVSNVCNVPGSTNLVTFSDNRILGGHIPFQAGYLSGGSSVFFGGVPKYVRSNLGYNPVGPLPIPTVPANNASTSGSAVDQTWTLQANAAGPTTITVKSAPASTGTVIIDPATLPLVIPAGMLLSVFQPAGTVLGFAYATGQAPTILSRTGN